MAVRRRTARAPAIPSRPPFVETNGRLAVIEATSWSSDPNPTAGCGGLTGITPLARYREWIVETARTTGSPLP